MGENRNEKSNKTHGSRKWKRGRHNWHKSNCHSYNQIDALPVSKQQLAWKTTHKNTPVIVEHDIMWYGISLWLVWIAVPAMSLPTCFPTPDYSMQRSRVRNKENFDTANIVQQQLKDWYVNNSKSQIQNTALSRLVWRKLFPSQPDQCNSWNKISVWYICPHHWLWVWPFKYLVSENGSNTIFWLAHGEFIIFVKFLWGAFNISVIQENM